MPFSLWLLSKDDFAYPFSVGVLVAFWLLDSVLVLLVGLVVSRVILWLRHVASCRRGFRCGCEEVLWGFRALYILKQEQYLHFPKAPSWHLAGFTSAVNLMRRNDKRESKLNVRKRAKTTDGRNVKRIRRISKKIYVGDKWTMSERDNLIGRRKVLQLSRAAMKCECWSKKVNEGTAPRAGRAPSTSVLHTKTPKIMINYQHTKSFESGRLNLAATVKEHLS